MNSKKLFLIFLLIAIIGMINSLRGETGVVCDKPVRKISDTRYCDVFSVTRISSTKLRLCPFPGPPCPPERISPSKFKICIYYSHAYTDCYDNDVYWYDSCGRVEDKKEECGTTEYLNEYRCAGNICQQKVIERGCLNGSCYENIVWKNVNYTCSWVDQECGGNDCKPQEMYQKWICSPVECTACSGQEPTEKCLEVEECKKFKFEWKEVPPE